MTTRFYCGAWRPSRLFFVSRPADIPGLRRKIESGRHISRFYYQVDPAADVGPVNSSSPDNQMQLLNLHYEVKRYVVVVIIMEKTALMTRPICLGWKKRCRLCCRCVTSSRLSSNRTRYLLKQMNNTRSSSFDKPLCFRRRGCARRRRG